MALVVEYYGFRLSRVGDLQYERGLLQRYNGSIPLDKLQTLTVRENALKRRFGYATLAVETAGYAVGTSVNAGVAVPLAPREEVYELARDIDRSATSISTARRSAPVGAISRAFRWRRPDSPQSPTPSTRWCCDGLWGSPPSCFPSSSGPAAATPRVRPRWLGHGDPERVLAADDAHCAVLPAPDGVRHAVAVPAPP